MKELKKIREELKHKAEREAYRMWRLAWRAQRHGCSAKTVAEIREEANWLYNTATAYPDRLLDWRFEHEHKYAFR